MIYIEKMDEPAWLSDYKQKNASAKYDSVSFKPYIGTLREYLIKEQKGLCAYCCCSIDLENSHNEHIEPRNPQGYASNKSLDYNNIVASCNGNINAAQSETSCGKHKGNSYDSNRFISPLDTQCETKFDYYPNGKIIGDEYTIDLLNLNSYRLKNARRAVYEGIKELDVDVIKQIYPEDGEKLPQFINVIRWYIRTISQEKHND